MKFLCTIMVFLLGTSCATIETTVEKSVSTYGHRAHIELRNEWLITGELLLQHLDQLWIVSLHQRIVMIPLRDVYTVEVLDTDVSAYFMPTALLLGAPWVIIGTTGAAYTGELEMIPAGILIGGLLTLLPTGLNEVGMTNPFFTANDIAAGQIGPFLRYPFHTISDSLAIQLLSSHGQGTPDTLRIPVVVEGE